MKEKITEQLPQAQPTIKPSSQNLSWVLIIVGSLFAMAGAIYLGIGAGKSLAPKLTYISQLIPTSNPEPSEAIIRAPTETLIITGVVTPPPDSTDEGTYTLDFSSTRTVTTSDLANLTPWELKVARNEIYARHGRDFVHQDLSCYFGKQAWYQVDPDYSDSTLSKLETANATFILNYEKEMNSPLINKDSGCNQDNL